MFGGSSGRESTRYELFCRSVVPAKQKFKTMTIYEYCTIAEQGAINNHRTVPISTHIHGATLMPRKHACCVVRVAMQAFY